MRTVRAVRSILCIYNNYESLYLMMLTTEVFYTCAWTSKVFYPKFNDSYRDIKTREVLNEVRDLIKKLPALIEVHELINIETSWKAKSSHSTFYFLWLQHNRGTLTTPEYWHKDNLKEFQLSVQLDVVVSCCLYMISQHSHSILSWEINHHWQIDCLLWYSVLKITLNEMNKIWIDIRCFEYMLKKGVVQQLIQHVKVLNKYLLKVQVMTNSDHSVDMWLLLLYVQMSITFVKAKTVNFWSECVDICYKTLSKAVSRPLLKTAEKLMLWIAVWFRYKKWLW